MGDTTGISWADKTFNIWIGCEHADAEPGSDDKAPECANCYAEAWDRRDLHGHGTHWGPGAPPRYLSDAYWRKPLAWNREAEERGVRFRVFCSSLADVFQRHRDPVIAARMAQERKRLWRLIRATPNLDWLLLTKRPENFATMLPWMSGPTLPEPLCRDCADRDGTCDDGMPCDPREPWPHVWLGVTAGVARSMGRVEILRRTAAARRFVSGEPLLEYIPAHVWDFALAPREGYMPVHWLIVGDESGSDRHVDPHAVAVARDAAERHGVSFHFKQWCGPGSPRIAGSLDASRKRRKIHLPILDGKRHDGVPR